MNKSFLILNVSPNDCINCPLAEGIDDDVTICDMLSNGKICPLQECYEGQYKGKDIFIPECETVNPAESYPTVDDYEYADAHANGWNECIKYIMESMKNA